MTTTPQPAPMPTAQPSALASPLDPPLRALTPAVMAEIYAALAPVYPAEGCGIVVEGADGAPAVIVSDNLTDAMRRLDPTQYSRRAENGYVLDTRLIVAAERAGQTLRVIFHSHPDVGVYFSAEDTQKALVDWGDGPEPAYPDVDYLVVAVDKGAATRAGLFRFDLATQSFASVASYDAHGARVAP
jgi:proteasome lid subunit RPN8/RPN11